MQPCGVGKHVDGRDGRGGLQDFAGDGGERRAAALGGKASARRTAIRLTSVAVRADEEESTAIRSFAKSLMEESLWGWGHEPNQRAMDNSSPMMAT